MHFLVDAAARRLGGVRCLASAVRYISQYADGLVFGSYGIADEAALAASFLQSNPPGGVIDIGANKGDWSAALLKLQPRFAKLLVCEPQISLKPDLVSLFSFNRDVFIEQTAVGASSGNMVLYSNGAGSTLASMYHRELSHVGVAMDDQQVVPVTTVDLLLEKYGLAFVSFLKLDAEGHELEILKGSEQSLFDHRIRALSFEFGGCNIDSRTYFKDFWQLLVHRHGYSLFRILPSRRLFRFREYSETLEQFNWQTVLACAPGTIPIWKVV